MQTEILLDLLRASGADAWELTDTVTDGWEFYFIRHRLDQNRVRRVEHIRVKVYRRSEDGQFLGSAEGEIAPTASTGEAAASLKRLLEQAALVKDPFYTLNAPSGEDCGTPAPADPAAIARDFIEVMRALPETDTEDVNSYEIFVNAKKRRFVNSNGIDVTDAGPSSMLEAVINARSGGHEIELYRSYTSGTCDREGLLRSLSDTLRCGRDRLAAVPTPALGKCDLVLTTRDAAEVYDWFIRRMHTGMKVQGISTAEPGKPLADFGPDRPTVTALRYLENSSSNAAYDPEGKPIHDRVIVEDGVARAWWGGRQYSQYLGVEDNMIPGNFAVSGGTGPAASLQDGRWLEVVDFSDFQVSTITGDIAGEIRLGYLHEDGRVTVVTGGSVSGSLPALTAGLRFSSETRQYDDLVIPAFTRIAGVSVTGAEG